MLPWTDRAGRFSALKLACFVGILLPLAWLALKASAGALGPRPYDEAVHETGRWALRFLVLTLAVTPLRRLLSANRLILVRRQLGLAVLGYVVLHLGLYAGELGWNVPKLLAEMVLRVYLLIGTVALALLIALGATSTDGAIKRLGAARWNRLHSAVYAVAALGLVHAFLQAKRDATEPLVIFGLIAFLLGFRLWRRLGAEPGIAGAAILAALCVLATALLEAAIYGRGVVERSLTVLAGNIEWALAPRPAHDVLLWLGAGLALAALATLRNRGAPARAGRREPRSHASRAARQ